MRFSNQTKLIAALTALALLAGCATGRTADTRRGVLDAAASPVRDLNLFREPIPPLLLTLDYPYSTGTLTSGCPAIAHEISQLDAILGPESYQPGQARNIWDQSGDLLEEETVDVVRDTAQDLVPFRSWVRRLSGASSADRQAIRAFANGQQRRTFLRGYGAAIGCRNIIPPPRPTPAATQR